MDTEHSRVSTDSELLYGVVWRVTIQGCTLSSSKHSNARWNLLSMQRKQATACSTHWL
jgi:hypothetical protein